MLLLLFGVACAQSAIAEDTVRQIEDSIFQPELVLPASLEKRREEFNTVVISAQKRLRLFANKYEWGFLLKEPLLKRVEIFDSKESYDEYLRKAYPETKDQPIPSGFTASFEKDNFYAVAPEVYAKCVPQFVETDFYEKLIAHELAHKLHTRLVNGQEEKMGPMWFWEGFATYASSQFENDTIKLTSVELSELLKDPKRGDYRKYNRAFKHFIKLIPMPEFVRRAATEKDLNSWLLKNANP
jgi:hypothetical protein